MENLTKEQIAEKLNIAEEKIRKEGLLKFQENIVVNENLDEFILYLINIAIPKYSTYFVINDKIDCDSDYHRSVCDIFRLVAFYKPEVTLLQVVECLFDLKFNQNKIHGLWCHNILKITFFRCFSRSYYNEGSSIKKDYSLENLTTDQLKILCKK